MWKKRNKKTAVCVLLCILFVLQLRPVKVQASEYWPEGPDTLSPAVILMEESTGTILYEKNSQEAHYPASITKILTTLLALENCSLDEVVTFSDRAIDETIGSGIARDYGEQMTLEQCLYGVMLESANECAFAVAEHVGGTMENFVDMMNAKAKELGCVNTNFANPHGLQDENHYTCAYDMALIAKAAYENETFRIITGTKIYTIPPTNKHAEDTILRNHHDMLTTYHSANAKYLYPDCVGGKTGYTDAANSTLVTYAERDGMTLICVVMNTQSPNQFEDTTNLFNYAFDNFQMINIADNETKYSSQETVDAGALNNNQAFVDIDTSAGIVLPKTAEFSDAASEITYDNTSADVAGSLSYTYAGRNIGSANIVRTGAVVDGFVFDNQKQEDNTEVEPVSTIQIKPIAIIGIIFLILLLGILIFLGKKFYDNYYIIRHNLEVRKIQKEKFKHTKRVKKRRRRRKW